MYIQMHFPWSSEISDGLDSMVYRYVGYGKKSIQQKIGGFKDFWTMCSTKLVEYYAMSVSLEKDM